MSTAPSLAAAACPASSSNTVAADRRVPLILLDVDAVPIEPRPKVVTSHSAYVRVIQARNKLVVLDSDLAELYCTTVDAVNKAALRNACRFSRRTCFRLSNDEWHYLKHRTRGAAGLAEADRGDWLCARWHSPRKGPI